MLASFVDWLLRCTSTDPWTARNGRWLNAIVLTLIGRAVLFFVAGFLAPGLGAGGARPISAGLALILVGLYGLNRRGSVTAAASAVIGIYTAGIMGALYLVPIPIPNIAPTPLLLLLAGPASARWPQDTSPANAPQGDQSLARQSAGDLWHTVAESAFQVQGHPPDYPQPVSHRGGGPDHVKHGAGAGPAGAEAVAVRNSAVIITLPLPDGTAGHFRFVESPIMEPTLAAKYPDIKTYLGQGIDDPNATVRVDHTPAGFHAMILGTTGTIFIDPYSRGDTVHYVSYYTRDYPLPMGKIFKEVDLAQQDTPAAPLVLPNPPSSIQLRTYRMAVAADGEYTIFQGGTVAAALAAINSTVNRVDGVYEREFAIRLVLIANDNLIIYTNPATDPYDNSNEPLMLTQNQANLDTVIGDANYDIGHVFSTSGTGVASLEAVCQSGLKGRGETGVKGAVGDPFDIDFVSHEVGHSFGAGFGTPIGSPYGTGNEKRRVRMHSALLIA